MECKEEIRGEMRKERAEKKRRTHRQRGRQTEKGR